MFSAAGDKRGLRKIGAIFLEIVYRLRAAIIILLWGDIVNGNIKRLRKALAEVDHITAHIEDMSKSEIIDRLMASGVDDGVRHHLAHILMSQAGWRFFLAQTREAEWHHLRQAARKQVRRESLQVILETVEDDILESTLALLDLGRVRHIAGIVSEAIVERTVRN